MRHRIRERRVSDTQFYQSYLPLCRLVPDPSSWDPVGSRLAPVSITQHLEAPQHQGSLIQSWMGGRLEASRRA